MGVAHANAKVVVGAVAERAAQQQAGVEAEVDQVTVLQRRAHQTHKARQGVVRVFFITPQQLVAHGIPGVVAPVLQGLAAALCARERQAVLAVALVGKILAVVPGAYAVGPAQRRGFARFHHAAQTRVGELQLRDRQRAATERKAGAVAVLQLRVAAVVVFHRAAVEDAGQQRHAIHRPGTDARAQR